MNEKGKKLHFTVFMYDKSRPQNKMKKKRNKILIEIIYRKHTQRNGPIWHHFRDTKNNENRMSSRCQYTVTPVHQTILQDSDESEILIDPRRLVWAMRLCHLFTIYSRSPQTIHLNNRISPFVLYIIQQFPYT